MTEPTYIIGIDLGTTNTVVAYTKAKIKKGEKAEVKILDMPQLVDASVIEKKDILPSFIFIPGKHDVAEDALSLPWSDTNKIAVGEFAKERGAQLPHRLISSAKSWLCNTMVDRNEKILPWGGDDDIVKMSPVESSSVILKHIFNVWNYTIAVDNPELSIEKQDIFLTVPASFDAVARDLTMQAAKMAGLENITLLEEPQAAFYAWIEASEDSWRDEINSGDMILVCDVGGGTTDFSLIQAIDDDGQLALERIAVGDHLLVGGDNMDLALAWSVNNKMAEKRKKLDSWQMMGLVHSCRKAKENLFTFTDQALYPITILGRGSSLIGGTIKTKLESSDVEEVIVNGFFPKCNIDSKPVKPQRSGIQELGLSYESDPAITRHLAHFLSSAGSKLPTAVFFNGGIMKASAVREQILDIIASWSDGENLPPREIKTGDFDLSVARGAAYYGVARRGEGVRIRGGLPRSYYIAVAASMPAVPGMPVPVKALCVAPFGMEEGTKAACEDQDFVVVVGEQVKFDLLASTSRYDDKVGSIIENWENDINSITSIETVLTGEYGSFVPVNIEIHVTEVGTLEFWCVAREDDRKWKLEFNVREKE